MKPARPKGASRKIPWPDDLTLTDSLRAYAEQHLTDADPVGLFEQFRSQSKAKGWNYVDWEQAWQVYVRNARSDSGHWAAGQYPRARKSAPSGPVAPIFR